MRYFFGRTSTRPRPVNPSLGHRRLSLEPLEVRQMLDVSLWQNPDRALDVDADQFVVGQDALIIVNRINSGVDPQLPTLGFGEVPDYYYDVDGDGFASATDVLLIANRLNASNAPPVLSAALTNDTGPGGVPNSDGITSDASISGQVTDAGPLVFFTARLNDSPAEVSIKGLIQPNGTFQIPVSLLEQLNDGSLDDGAYTVHITAVNEIGFPATKSIAMTLDRLIATPPVPDLAAASDTGVSDSDNITKITTPQITVAAEPGSLVTLYVDGLPTLEAVASPTATFNLAALPDGKYQITARAVDGAGNLSSPTNPLELTVRSTAPVIQMLTVPYQDDLTPMVKAVITSTPQLTNGTPVYLDIDRNNDGDYDDPDELGTAQATVFDNNVSLHVSQALDATRDGEHLYPIKVRIRTSDEAGNDAVEERSQVVDTVASTALADYVAKDDGFFSYEAPVEIMPRQSGYRAYTVRMTSQQWRTLDDVNKPVWQHWITIVVPTGMSSSNHTALLHVTGGNNTSGRPTSVDANLVLIAQATRSIVINLPQIPSEPLVFTADEAPGRQRSEDEIIAYSYDEFLKNPDDTEWPVLVAMVKATVKAMDTVQELVAAESFPTAPVGYTLDNFVVTGGSKRGWTTWLTPAVDDRVRAIMPTVFDALNLDEQMQHHYGVYGFFSQAIQDYEEEAIFERMLTENGAKLGRIVDPYHYIAAGEGYYDIPKYAIVSAGDEFFVSDSSQYYFDDLPGTQNYLRYVPNAGHGLNQDAILGGLVWFNAIVNNIPLPKFTSKVLDDGSLQVTATDLPLAATLWQSTNPIARDYRDSYTGVTWTSTPVVHQGGGLFTANVPKPATGATAFFIELTYTSGLIQPFKFTTQISVQTGLALYDWPFDVAEPVAAPLPAAGSLAAASQTGEGSLADALTAAGFAVSLPTGGEAVAVAAAGVPLDNLATSPLAAGLVAAADHSGEQRATLALALASDDASTDLELPTDESLDTQLVDSLFDDQLLDTQLDWDELFAPLKSGLV